MRQEDRECAGVRRVVAAYTVSANCRSDRVAIGIERKARRARGMRGAVSDRQRGEEQQRHDLDSVDPDIDEGGTVDSLERDPDRKVSENYCNYRHEYRSGNSRVHRA